MRPSTGCGPVAGGAVLDEAGRFDDALAQDAQREPEVELAAVELHARRASPVEALVRHQEVAALEQLDRVAHAPGELAVDVLVAEPAFAVQLLLR